MSLKDYIEYDKFSCNSVGLNFTIVNNEISCDSLKCDDSEEIYNKYYNNLIKKYLI